MTQEIQLTNEELKAAAVKLCQIRGISPYLMAGPVSAASIAELEIKKFMELVQAIDYAKGEL